MIHIYSPVSDGESYVYLGKLTLAGFRHDAAASRLVGIEVNASKGMETLKAYEVNAKGLVSGDAVAMSSDKGELEAARTAITQWAKQSRKQWWHTDLAALQANVWNNAALTWTGEATGEKSELSNALFNIKVSGDLSLGKSRAKSVCHMK